MSTLLRPLGFSEILDSAFTLYRHHFTTFFATALVSFLPLLFLSPMLTRSAADPESVGVGFVVVLLVVLLAMTVGWAALTWQAARGINREPLSFGGGMQRGLRSTPALVAAFFIGYLLVGVLFLVVALVIGVIGGIVVVATGPGAGGGIFAVIGLAVGILSFIGAVAALFAVSPAVVVERRGPVSALKRSWQLARGAWLRVFGIVAVSWLIVMLPNMGLYALGAGTGLFSPTNAAAPGTTWVVLEASMSFLISSLTYPFFVAAMTLLYFDRRVRAEAYDLEVAARDLALSH